MKNIVLVTGGTGFIGSHTCIELIKDGFSPIILDNFSNSSSEIIDRIEEITNFRIRVIKGDILDSQLLDKLFAKYSIQAVLHFAGLKAVSESVLQPLQYYDNNVTGSLCLLNAMQKAQVKTLVFSSSATVYGRAADIPYNEMSHRSPINPYGRSKMMVEEILSDLFQAQPDWSLASLRYFNPVGAHESGLIGEDPLGIPSNLMPCLAQVASNVRPILNIFGKDYPTPDGTCIRDYIHVMDLAEGHLLALKKLLAKPQHFSLNLGSGIGTSTLEMVNAFQVATGCRIHYQFVDRRPGDLPAYWANPQQANQLLNWQTTRTIQQMCQDTWRWQQYNFQKRHSLI